MNYIRLRIILVALVFITFSSQAYSQTFGVRAGLNYSTFYGDALPEETHGFSNGFHFGITYAYNFTDLFSIRTEIVYQQTGAEYDYNGDSYYIIRQGAATTYEKGQLDYKLNISNAQISIPIMANYRINRKWEVFGGPYVNMLVGPTGRGELRFESFENEDDIVFRQSLDFRYNNNEADEVSGRFLGLNDIGIRVDGTEVTLPRFAGAYYQQGVKTGNRFNFLDVGLTAGFHYFLNKGFFVGMQFDYGFLDLTNDNVDISLEGLNDDNSFIFSDDKDKHFGYHISFGFRF